MPANLPPEYHEAEKAYRTARAPQEKIEAVERMLAIMPHHKGTDRLRAELRTRMAKLTQEAERLRSAGGKAAQIYQVPKEGAGQALLVGLANAGKSSLMAALSSAPVKVADYPYTTELPQPAMMPFEDIHVQLVDLPPIIPGDMPGWVRGLLRQADLLLLVLDLTSNPASDLNALLEELAGARIEALRPPAGEGDDLMIRKPAVAIGNKLDAPGAQERAAQLARQVAERLPLWCVSARRGDGLEELRRGVVDAVGVVRVYAKPPGRPPDMERPFVLPRGATVVDLAEDIHRDWLQRLKYAVLWAPNRPALRIARDYVLRDRDVVELHVG